MSILTCQIKALSLRDSVVTDVYGGDDEGNAVYKSGDGITVDNISYKINVDGTVARDTDIKEVEKLADSANKTATNAQSTASSAKSTAETVQTNLTNETTRAIVAENWISAKVDAKIKINNLSAETLSILSIDADEYYNQFAKDDSKDTQLKFKDNKLYVLTSDDGYMNVHSQRVGNMADPEDGEDAVTKNYLTSNYVDNHSDQEISGYKQFKSGLDIGDHIEDVGNNCLAIGNDLSVGARNFFWKGIDVSTSTKQATFYLCREQPRYPYPFVKLNGSSTQFKINGKPFDISNPNSSLSVLSAGKYDNCWKCTLDAANGRTDYNQLSIDYAEKNGGDGAGYKNDETWVRGKISEYFADAFRAEEDNLAEFKLSKNVIKDKDITIVNDYKQEYLRCGTIESATDTTMTVKLNDIALNDLTAQGLRPHEFDYDDVSLMFVDQPGIPAPANTTTYGSIAVGAKNTVLRRCSIAVGKDNKTESDFCVALGRKATADKYCSFVWAPNKTIKAANHSTFTIGLGNTIDQASKYRQYRTIYVADDKNNSMELMKFICECVKNDSEIKTKMKDALGIQ